MEGVKAFQDVADADADADAADVGTTLSGGVKGTASMPRRCSEGQAASLGDWAVGLPLPVPGLVPPGRRMPAAVPKLTRRVKGVTGAVRDVAGESSSSMAFSSRSEELVERLARRPSPVALVGDVPDIPKVLVERESLLRCSWMAAAVMALGKTGVAAVELLRNMWEKAVVVTELRRLRCMSAAGEGEGGLLELELSEDMMEGIELCSSGKKRILSQKVNRGYDGDHK